jgi:hypothetical protein
MSRPYKVTTQPPVGKTIVAEDHVVTQLDIPPTMPREEMARRLTEELTQRGFNEDEGGKLVRERGGVTVQVDPEEQTVRVSSEAEKDLPPPSNPSPCTCRAVQSMHAEQEARSDLQRAVTRRLEGAIGRLGCELEGVVHRVVTEALKERAQQLGRVKQTHEDPKTGELTIVVEVGA